MCCQILDALCVNILTCSHKDAGGVVAIGMDNRIGWLNSNLFSFSHCVWEKDESISFPTSYGFAEKIGHFSIKKKKGNRIHMASVVG